jgi:hypothetical protein
VLTALSIAVSLLAGLFKGPWWFWLVGGATLAALSITSPDRVRASYAEASAVEAVPLLMSDLKAVSTGCALSAAAFAAGSIMSWALPI